VATDSVVSASLIAKLLIAVSLIAVSLVAGGCRASLPRIEPAREAYFAGDFETARKHLVESTERDKKLADVARLELAIVELSSGNPTAADALLRQSRKTFDLRNPPETRPTVRSLMTDERSVAYDTAGYEDVMIRSLLSIASLMSESGDAESYAMQAQIAQQALAEQAEERGLENIADVYQPLALAPYVRGLIRESNHHDYDDAERAYSLVAQWQPSFQPAAEDVARAAGGTHSVPGHGVLYVFAFVGLGPQRVADVADATGPALLIADRIVAASSKYEIPPTLAPIPVPRVIVPPSGVDRIGIAVNGVPAGMTSVLTDVGRLARTQSEAEMPWTVARGVVRRVAKKAMVAGSINALGGEGSALGSGGALLGSLWEAAEQPDIRCWSLLPREIQVLRLELPKGQHRISANALGMVRPGVQAEAEVTIIDGRNSYVLVTAPVDRVTSVAIGLVR
jgi:uncharacterized protein